MSSTGCTEKCFAASTECVRALLEVGANVDTIDDKGYTALCIAAEQGNTELVKLLVAHGANINHCSMTADATPLLLAAKNLKRETAMTICQLGGDITSKHIFKLSLISYGVLDLLMDCGVDLHKRDRDGWTALHWAACKGSVDGVLALLDVGLDIEAETDCGWTPLHVAIVNLNFMAVRTLLKHGADSYKRDKNGYTAEDIALLQSGVNIGFVDLMEEAM